MTTAALAMAYGTPADRGSIAAYYTDIRRGRPPSPEQLADLVARYDAIGGVSPLNARTAEQLDALQRGLDALRPGQFSARYGAKHAAPSIEAAVAAAAQAGAERLVGVVLAPHYSQMSVGEYLERAAMAAKAVGLPASFLEHWHDEPALIAALATRVRAALASLAEGPDGTRVLFTAHSLPERIRTSADPYPDEVAETARLVAAAVGLAEAPVAWQSAARTGEPWLGPDVGDVIASLAEEGARAVVVCPVGFTSDHLEILYDLDVLARGRAEAVGVAFTRTASLNAEPAVFDALAARLVALDEALAER